MALYEITFLTREESDPGVRTTIEQIGGTIQEENPMGRKRLTYPIQKETQAVYTSYVFDTVPANLVEINRRLGLNNAVMRYLIVTKDEVKASKEVSKTVREAIAAAEKLEDTVVADEPAKADIVVEEPVIEEIVAETIEAVPAATVEEVAEATPEMVETVIEAVAEKPAKKPRAKKAEAPAPEADAATATEEDRLKALEDKLGEILKD